MSQCAFYICLEVWAITSCLPSIAMPRRINTVALVDSVFTLLYLGFVNERFSVIKLPLLSMA